MTIQFTKATKESAKLRLAIFGPSGSGKTYTALRLATGMGGPIAFIDTERRTARKYSDRFDFDVLELDQRTIESYVAAIQAAGQAGYPVLIIDSLSHAWQELLEEIDRLTRAKFGGNKWRAWSEGTPKQRDFIDALLNYNGHVIATMRSKTEWDTEKDDRGKVKPVRVGLSPEQGKGIEYEFDMLIELSPEHTASITKDRTGQYQDQMIDKPGEDLGRELVAWLGQGEAPTPRPKLTPAPSTNGKRAKLVDRINELAGVLGLNVDPAWLDGLSETELTAYGKELRAQVDGQAKQPEMTEAA